MTRTRALAPAALDVLGAAGGLVAALLVLAPLVRAGVSPLAADPEVLVGVYGPSWLLALAPLALGAWAWSAARPDEGRCAAAGARTSQDAHPSRR